MQLPVQANWKNNAENADMYALTDIIPASVGGLYSAGTGRLHSAYWNYIDSLCRSAGAGNQNFERYTELMADANHDYLKYKAARDDFIAKRNAPLANISRKFTENTVTLGNGDTVPKAKIFGDLLLDIKNWENRGDGDCDINVTINKDQQVTSPWHKTIKVSTEYSACHSAELHSYVDVTRLISDANYNLNFTAIGAAYYEITRGDWFDASFIRTDAALPQGSRFTLDSFFGKNGSMHLIPTGILVLYRPCIELTVSTEIYQDSIQNNTDLTADLDNPAFSLFGMTFDMKMAYEQGVKIGETTTTIKIPSPKSMPTQIIGFTGIPYLIK